MRAFTPDRKDIWAGAGIFLVVYAYLILRAVHVPLVHDEIATFFNYVQRGLFLPHETGWDANNHILNTFLSMISYRLSGFSEFALRLPNLLIAPVYFYYTFRIAMKLNNRYLAWLMVSVLWGMHFTVGFLALCRGYGMSLAFLMASVWHLMIVLEKNRMRDFIAVLVWMIMAIFSNLNLIITYTIMLVLLGGKTLSVQKAASGKKASRLFLLIAFGILPAVAATWLLFIMKGQGQLYYGIEGGFYEATLLSLFEYLFGSRNRIAAGILILAFVFVALLLVLFFRDKDLCPGSLLNPSLAFPYLLTGNLLAIFLIHRMLGVNYPQDRTAMHLLLFLAGSLFYLTGVSKTGWLRRYSFLLLSPLIAIPIHFIFHVNLTHTLVWKDLVIPERYFETIKNNRAHGVHNATVGAYKLRTLTWYYLNYREGITLNQIHDKTYPTSKTDYLIVEPHILPLVEKEYKIIDQSTLFNHFLLRKKDLPGRTLLVDIPSNETGKPSVDEYFLLAKGSLDTLRGQSIYAELNLNITSPSEPFWCWIVCEVKDKDDKMLDYNYISLPYLKKGWQGSVLNFRSGIVIPELPAEADHFICYVWNMDRAAFRTGQGSVAIYRLED
jgi:hypothetical protein